MDFSRKFGIAKCWQQYLQIHHRFLHKDVVWRLFRREGYSFKKNECKNPKADKAVKEKSDFSPWKKR